MFYIPILTSPHFKQSICLALLFLHTRLLDATAEKCRTKRTEIRKHKLRRSSVSSRQQRFQMKCAWSCKAAPTRWEIDWLPDRSCMASYLTVNITNTKVQKTKLFKVPKTVTWKAWEGQTWRQTFLVFMTCLSYWVCELRSQSLIRFSDMIRKMFWCSRDHSQVKTAFMLLFVQMSISHGGSLLSWPSIKKDFQSTDGSDCFCMQPLLFAPELLNYQSSLRDSIVAKNKCSVEMVLKDGWQYVSSLWIHM